MQTDEFSSWASLPTPTALCLQGLIGEVGEERVARHWGDYRSSALSTFRNGRYSYRRCPRCNFRNTSEVKHDCCDRRLVEVLLEEHDDWYGHSLDEPSQRERLWPVDTSCLWVWDQQAPDGPERWTDSIGHHWRRFEPGSDFRKHIEERHPFELRVWVERQQSGHAASVDSDDCTLPLPEWPKDNEDVDDEPPLGGPGGRCLPAKLKGWARCGSWKGPARPKHAKGQTSSTVQYFGCPSPWIGRGVRYDDDDSSAILRGVRSQFGKKDTDLLMLCEDGSHGLDLR